MVNYTTSRIDYLFNGDDNIIKKILKKYFFTKKPYSYSNCRAPYIKFKRTSKEELEWNKCKNDIVYFAENYYYNLDLYGEKYTLIKLRDYQKNVLYSYVANKTIVCSARQMGITTLNKIYALWLILFDVKYVQIIFEPTYSLYEFMKSLGTVYVKLPYFLQKGIIKISKNEIICDDYSRITNVQPSPISKRFAENNYTIIVDNAAWLRRFSFSNIEQHLKYGNKIIISSAPNGLNLFYKLWMNSINENTFKLNPIRLTWSDNKNWTNEWAEKMINNCGQDKFDEEFNLIFRNKDI